MSRFPRYLSLCAALVLLPIFASAQKTPPRMPPVAPVPSAPPAPSFGPQEKAIVVGPDVTLSLCVLRGRVSVNSWKRSEVRVFTAEGTSFEFKTLQKDASGTPVWISVIATPRPPGKTAVPPSDCLNEDDIEIDVPTGTSLTVKGREVVLSVDSVRNVTVGTFAGDTALRNIADGISAGVNRGNLSIEDSAGAISVESTTGNILAFGVKPMKPGDTFRARTLSGNIVVVDSSHRQIDAGTISGAVSYTGAILNGGTYRFSTQSGNVRLTLPKDTSATIAATYGFGSFSRGFPIEIATENIEEGMIKSVVGTIGKPSDSTIKITTTSGNIEIRSSEERSHPKH
ncbi:MAG: hypothetical protein UZ17_ACD001001501 [Acidobacteria bacterium OLB17]|nr:MAG: hypothetical protein UZ17_ACD001001501 [Acidobacteria bacterium OLB17]MCZ2391309.1 DUF4097 domain-containing protein [Acidobacteriota bacterium]